MRTAAAIGLCVILSACGLTGATPDATPVAGTTSPPVQKASAPRITPPPVNPPDPPGTNLPNFSCANTGGGAAGVANLTDVRIAQQAGYERVVLQFDHRVPSYTVKRQAKPVFRGRASGQPVTLSGIAGALVQIHSATASGTYHGPTDIRHPDFQVLSEAKIVEDFEGYLSWGLGLGRAACLRTFTLTEPARLVIDFKTA
jgi:hypothetical protein